jgi:hypothetical protein
MIKTVLKLALAVAIAGLLASSVYAGPILLSDDQMDAVAAGGMEIEIVEGFVCPVISGKGVVHNDKFFSLPGGYYSFRGPDVMVPKHATNRDGDGRPGPTINDFAKPGDTDYSAVWGFRPPPQ